MLKEIQMALYDFRLKLAKRRLARSNRKLAARVRKVQDQHPEIFAQLQRNRGSNP